MPRYRHRRHNRGKRRYPPPTQVRDLQAESQKHRDEQHRLPCWQYLLSFAVVGGIIAAIVLLVTNYTGDPSDEPAAPPVAPIAATRAASHVPTQQFLPATADALATAGARWQQTPTTAPASTPPASTPAPTPFPTPTATPGPTATPRPTATTGPTATPRPTATPLPPSRSTTAKGKYVNGRLLNGPEIERLVVEFTNQERERAGLQLLVHDPAISDIARAHSANMVRLDIFSHDIGGKDATDRALDSGYDCRGVDGHARL